MDTEIRVSTESWPWRRKVSCWDLNLWPFDLESGALTTEEPCSPTLLPNLEFNSGPGEILRVHLFFSAPMCLTLTRMFWKQSRFTDSGWFWPEYSGCKRPQLAVVDFDQNLVAVGDVYWLVGLAKMLWKQNMCLNPWLSLILTRILTPHSSAVVNFNQNFDPTFIGCG